MKLNLSSLAAAAVDVVDEATKQGWQLRPDDSRSFCFLEKLLKKNRDEKFTLSVCSELVELKSKGVSEFMLSIVEVPVQNKKAS